MNAPPSEPPPRRPSDSGPLASLSSIPTARRALTIAGGVVALGLALGGVILTIGRAQSAPSAPAGSAPQGAASAPAPSAAPGAPNAPAQVEVQTEPPTTSPNVRIVFKIIPSTINATITWGKKRLGIIKPKTSLTVERPRDSGPLDVVVKSQGYINVHTRAYTFSNSVMLVKLTPIDKKNTIYGFREELPPETDGGVLDPVPGAPGTPDAGAR